MYTKSWRFVPDPRMKGVWWDLMSEWKVGIMVASLGPKMGAGRKAQVENVGVEAERIKDSASS
jgi:hypothetical protein